MRFLSHHTIRLFYLVITFHIFLLSCKIEDDHGTPWFVAGLDEFISTHGKLLGEYYIQSELYINDQYGDVYFLGCESNNGWCEEVSLISLNYESGNASPVFSFNINNSYVSIPEKQQFGARAYFFHHLHASNEVRIYEFNAATHEYKILWTEEAYIDPYRISINQEFAFYNRDYQHTHVYKRSFDGNEEVLEVEGEVIIAIPGSSQIVLRDVSDGRVFIYDYQLEIETFRSDRNDFFNKVYSSGNKVYYLNEYDLQSIVNLKNGQIVLESSNNQFLLDFNPHCLKAVFMESIQFNSNSLVQLMQTKIIIKDSEGTIFQTPVMLYNDYLDFAEILNDGKTIIYSSMGKIYLTTTLE